MLPVKLLTAPAPEDQQYLLTRIIVFRACTALMGASCVSLVFSLARRWYDRPTAFIAAAFMAVQPLHCLHSALTTLDVPMSFLLLTCLRLWFRATDRRTLRSFAAAGLSAGILMGTKLTGCLFLSVPVLHLALLRFGPCRPEVGEARIHLTRFAGPMLLFFSVSALTFAVSTPHAVLSFDEYCEFMEIQKMDWYDRPTSDAVSVLKTWSAATIGAVGLPFAILSALGVPASLRKRSAELVAVLAFVCGYYIFWRAYLPVRFLLFVTPLFCILSAVTVRSIFSSRTVACHCFVALLIAWSALGCTSGIWKRWHDPRADAARYVANCLSPGTSIGIAGESNHRHWTLHDWRYPPINFSVYKEMPFLDQPEVIVVSSIELRQFQNALASPKLRPDFTWQKGHESDWYECSPPSPEVFRFYDRLLTEEDYTLVAAFTSKLDRFAPHSVSPVEIRIYQRCIHRDGTGSPG